MQYSYSLFHFIKFHSGFARWPKQQKNDLTHWLWINAYLSGSSKVRRVETVSCYFALVIYNTCRDGRRRHRGPSFSRPHGYHTETSHLTEAATLQDPSGSRSLSWGLCWRNWTEVTKRPVGNQRDGSRITLQPHSRDVQPQREADRLESLHDSDWRSLMWRSAPRGGLEEWVKGGISPWKWTENADFNGFNGWFFQNDVR